MKNVSNFVLNLYNNNGSFSYSPANKISNLYSTCFGVMCLDLIDELDNFQGKDKVAEYIQSYQDKDTGYFTDQSTIPKDNAAHDQEYIHLQLTDFAQLALSALSKKALYEYTFLKEYKDKQFLEEWFYGLNWTNPWLVSNSIMFVLNCLIYEGEDKNKPYIEFIIELLNKTQNYKNGYWNLGNKVTLHNQMAGAYHFIFFYTYLGIRPNYIEKIIDSTLSIQNYDGLFNYGGGGGGCDDLDAIDLLCRSQFYKNYRRNDILEALKVSHQSILKNQNSDGGFCWAKVMVKPSFLFKSLVDFKLLNYSKVDYIQNIKSKFLFSLLQFFPWLIIWRYSGTKAMQLRYSQSDLFSTWFRLTSLAFIEETFPEVCNYEKSFEWNFRKKCGLGFYKK